MARPCHDLLEDRAIDELLRHRGVVFLGRPEANSLACWSEWLRPDYQGAAFEIDGQAHASKREGLILASRNPLRCYSSESP